MNSCKPVKKILLIVFGCIIAVILAEAGLNTLEFVYKKIFGRGESDDFYYAEKACRIICLGDSWTLGMGAVPQKDYPSQLETILNESPGIHTGFKVYNLGYPNFTSSMAIKKFKDIYPQLKPNIVIAMIGRSDNWIFENTNIEKTLYQKIKKVLLNTRIAKLFKISAYNIQYNVSNKKPEYGYSDKKSLEKAMSLIQSGNDLRAKNMFAAAEDCYDKAITAAPRLSLGFIEKARNCKLSSKYDQALAVLRQGLVWDIENKEMLEELNDIFIMMNDPGRRVGFYYMLFCLNPRSVILKHQLAGAYIVFAEALFADMHVDKAIENYEKALKLEPENKEIFSSIIYNQALISKSVDSPAQGQTSKNEGYKSKHIFLSAQEKILESNLRELVEICRKNKIKLIFSGYPLEISAPMQYVAADCGITLIDHMDSFHNRESDFFVADGHCNSAGYKIIAENIAKFILFDQSNQTKR